MSVQIKKKKSSLFFHDHIISILTTHLTHDLFSKKMEMSHVEVKIFRR